MTTLRSLLPIAALVAIPIAALVLLLPSVTTLDLHATTDRAEVELLGDPAFDGNTIALSDALVCGEFSTPAASSPGARDPCQSAGRALLFASFKGHLNISGKQRFTFQRLREKELELALVSNTSMVFYDQDGTTRTVKSAYIRVPKSFFKLGNFLTFVTRADKMKIGGTGGTNGNFQGAVLTGGSAIPLANSLFTANVVRGTPVPLSMGDIVEFNRLEQGPSDDLPLANIVLRAGASDGIAISARLPIVELNVRNFAGQGVPISMSWWERLVSEPALLLIWAVAGFAATLVDWKAKFSGSERGRSEERCSWPDYCP
jgi:hypothetical protein